MLLRETFPVGPFASNCTVLGCADTKEAVIVDAGGAPGHAREVVEMWDLTVRAIILTHGHLDHILAIREFEEAFGVEVCLHERDKAVYDSAPAQAVMFGLPPFDLTPVGRYLHDGESIEFGKRSARVIHTPGHTPGSVCFAVEDDGDTLLFSGDTLFCRGIGRTDLPGGDTQQLFDSIRTKIYTLPPETLVVPGHGETTRVGDEMKMNPFVRV